MAYLQLRETEKAETYFVQVLEMFPNSEVGITNLARSKMQSGEYETAIDALVSIKDNKVNSTQIKLLLIDSYQRSGAIDKAINVANELINQFPNDSFYYQRVGSLYGYANQFDKARAAFNKSISLDENNIASIIHIARMDIIEGKTKQAREYLQSKLDSFKNSSLLMSEISDSYLAEKDVISALNWINKAYAQDLNDFYILTKLVELLSLDEQLDKAIEVTDLYIGQNPNDARALPLIASLYQEAKKDQQAILVLRDYVKKAQNQASAYILLAKAQEKAGENLGAIQSYKKATVIDDTSLPVYIGLVNLIIKSKNENYALSLIEHIYKLTKSESLREVLRGDLYASIGQHEKSGKFYLKAIELSDQKQAIIGLYNSYREQNKLEQALPYLQQWISKYPDDLPVEISLADAFFSVGKVQQSIEQYESLLTKYGKLPILLNNAANVYFVKGDKEKAQSYAQQAYDYVNNNVAIMDTLAWIESRMGNHEKALGLFRNALTQDFDNAEIKYHLAVTLKALGRDGEAKNYLIEAIDSEQKFTDKDKAKTLLDSWL